jgi:hypothetical protein
LEDPIRPTKLGTGRQTATDLNRISRGQFVQSLRTFVNRLSVAIATILTEFSKSSRRAFNRPASILPGIPILVDANIVIFLLLFRDLNWGAGMLAYGDLPGIYTYPPINPSLIGGLVFYPLAQTILSYSTGPFAAQNIVYLSSLFIPSFGFYWIGMQLRIRLPVALAAAVIFGTPIDPIFSQNFLNGSFQFGVLVLLITLALGFLIRALRNPDGSFNLVMAGILWGLAVTSSGNVGGTFEYTAAILATAMLSPYALFVVASRLTDSWKRIFKRCSQILVPLVCVTLPVWAAGWANYASLNTKSGQLNYISDFVAGNVLYTFAPYRLASALLNAPLSVSSAGVWGVGDVLGWTALVLGILVVSILLSLRSRYRLKWIARIALLQYLLIVILMAGLSTGALLGLYRLLPVLGFIDNPTFLLYLAAISLGVMFMVSMDGAADSLLFHPQIGSALSAIGSRARTRSSRVTIIALHPPTNRDRSLFRLCCLGIVAVAVLASTVSVSPNLAAQLSNSPWTFGESPYVPGYFAELHQWYESSGDSGRANILLLPDSYLAYTQVSSFVPLSRLWFIPYLGTYLNSSVNATQLISVMSLAAGGATTSFGEAMAIEGIRFVILETDVSAVTLVPSYLEYPGVSVARNLVWSTLNSTPNLKLSWSDSHFVVYNLTTDWTASDRVPDLVVSLGNAAPANNSSALSYPTVIQHGLLTSPEPGTNGTNFSEWNHWPDYGVSREPNGSISMDVNGSSSIPYALFAGGIDVSAARNYSATPVSQNTVSFNASYLTAIQIVNISVLVPARVYFAVYVFWYNQTGNPSLYSEFSISHIANLSEGTHVVALPFNLTPGASFARLYLYAGSLSPEVNATVFLSNISVIQKLVPTILSEDPEPLLKTSQALGNANLIPLNAPDFFLPTFPITEIPSSFRVFAIPAVLADPIGTSSFNASFPKGLDNGVGGAATDIGYLLTTVRGCGTIVLEDQNSGGKGSSKGCNGTLVATTPLAEGSMGLSAELFGNFTLATYGYVLSASGPLNGTQSATISLSVGHLSILWNGTAFGLNYGYGLVLNSLQQSVLSVAGYSPLVSCIGCVVYFVYMARRHRVH